MGDNNNEISRNVYAILDFLQEEYNKSSATAESKESIEVAMQCLETAFGVNLRDVQHKPPVSLRNALKEACQKKGASSSSSSTSQSKTDVSNNNNE